MAGNPVGQSQKLLVVWHRLPKLCHEKLCGIRINKSSSCVARSRGRRGAGSEVTRDEWHLVERARRCKQSARSRAIHRLVTLVCVAPLLQAWQSAVPVSCSYLLSQWRGRHLSTPMPLHLHQLPPLQVLWHNAWLGAVACGIEHHFRQGFSSYRSVCSFLFAHL